MCSTGRQGENDHDYDDNNDQNNHGDDCNDEGAGSRDRHNNMSGTRKHKKSWPVVKFGEVVKNANLVERDLEAVGIERIVGFEHIDPENLHVRRWNTPGNGTSFSRKFIPGQTLFAKRRAYQRKVAFAEFEGICSGDILTLQSKKIL